MPAASRWGGLQKYRDRTHVKACKAVPVAAVIGAVAALLVAAPSMAAASAPLSGGNGDTGNYLCISDALPAQCADLLNNNATQGQHIILDSSRLGLGLGWGISFEYSVTETSPFAPGSGLNNRYNGDGVYEIQKKTPGGHNGCMGIIGAEVVWEPCSNGTTDWVLSNSGYWISILASNAAFDQNHVKNQPYGMSDQVNGTSNGSEVTVSNSDNAWFLIPSPNG